LKEQEHLEEKAMYKLKLYVIGRTPKSVEVIEELVNLLEMHLTATKEASYV
jgi:hypothetical protein